MDNITRELQASENFETEIFFRMARTLYSDCETQCESLFDIAMEKTNNFRNISPEVIIEDSRIIKVLRYCMLPVISQMKLPTVFGQVIGETLAEYIRGAYLSMPKSNKPELPSDIKECIRYTKYDYEKNCAYRANKFPAGS